MAPRIYCFISFVRSAAEFVVIGRCHHLERIMKDLGFPSGTVVKNPPVNVGEVGSIPGSGRSLGEGNSNPLQYSCLGNSMDRGAWQAIVHGIVKGWTQPSD